MAILRIDALDGGPERGQSSGVVCRCPSPQVVFSIWEYLREVQSGKGEEFMQKEAVREGDLRDNVLPHMASVGGHAEGLTC